MGNYNSGGHNRRHDRTSRYKQLDSFDYGKHLPIMRKIDKETVSSSIRWKDGGEIGIDLNLAYLGVRYLAGTEEVRERLYFESVPNNYGGERIYFACPYCGRRSRILYLHQRHFKCRKCAKLNYYSQQLTKNEDLTVYKMRKLLQDKFKVTESLTPHDMQYYRPERPKGMHRETYLHHITELYELQELYYRQFMYKAAQICGYIVDKDGNKHVNI